MLNFIASLVIYSIFFSSQFPSDPAFVMRAQSAKAGGPEAVNEKSLGVKVSASHAVVMDIESDKILFEKAKDLPIGCE